MITLNVKPSVKPLIRHSGKSIKIRDNQGNFFGSELRIFFSNNKKSKFAVLDYELPRGAGDNIHQITILDNNKNSIFYTRSVYYSPETLDDFLLT